MGPIFNKSTSSEHSYTKTAFFRPVSASAVHSREIYSKYIKLADKTEPQKNCKHYIYDSI